MDEEAAVGKLVPSQYPKLGPIDPQRARFPCCIVWSPLPLISWLIPCIGHIGICREDGVILDFAGPNFVCVDNFSFGAATRYIQVNREKCNVAPCSTSNVSLEAASEKIMTWDEALRKGTQEFQHRAYSLFTCNCHSFVANNLNRMSYCGRQNWNVVNLAALLFLKGAWVSKGAIVKTLLPFLVLFGVGLTFGGSTFLIMLAAFVFVLVGWFLLGTYCFKGLILL